jgi:cell division protein FtsI/penicillin-binding protein 2
LFSLPILILACASFSADENSLVIFKDMNSNQISIYGNHRFLHEKKFLPGSLFKLVVAQCILESNPNPPTYVCKHNPQDMPKNLYCSNRVLHGEVNLIQAIAYSCNNYFWEHATDCTIEDLIQTTKQLQWYLPPINSKSLFEQRNFALGLDTRQKVSPMDVFRFTLALAQQPIHPNILAAMMLAVKEGTAQELKELPINLTGKTGTGSIIGGDGDATGWFLGFWPAEKPQYVLVVMVTHGSGGATAVPLAKEFLTSWLND